MGGVLLIATVVSVHLLASMRPGPNFFICAKHGLSYPLKKALVTTTGVATGALVHVILGLLGFSAIIAQSLWLYNILKYVGAAYLIYLGIIALFTNKKKLKISSIQNQRLEQISSLQAFRIGLFTMLTNIMATVHFLGLFTTVIPPNTTMAVKVSLIIVLPTISWMWFSIVAVSFSLSRFRRIYIRFQRWINLIFATMMISLGLKLVMLNK
jgi:threonine/homoserine/homoserine lactone efflux protein